MTLFHPIKSRAGRALIGAFALATSLSSAADADTVLRFATLQSPQNPMIVELNKAFDEVKEKTDGRVAFQVSYGKESGFSSKQFLTALEAGLLDGALISTSAMSSDYHWTGVYGLPLLLPDAGFRRPIVEAAKPRLAAFAETKGVVPLAYPIHMDRWMVIYATRDMQTLADTKGMLIRTYDAATKSIAEALGGVPTSMAKSEVYMGLQRGTIDGAITGDTSAEAMHMDEVAPFILRYDTVFLPHILGVSEKAWSKVSPEDRETVNAIFKTWEEGYWAKLDERDASDSAFDYAREHGMKVIDPSPEIAAKLEAVGKSMAEEFAAVDDESRAAYEEVRQVIDKGL